jgi:hypothetical protein
MIHRLPALIAAALLAAGPARAEAPAEEIAARARRVLGDDRFQTEHPPARDFEDGASLPLDLPLGEGRGADRDQEKQGSDPGARGGEEARGGAGTQGTGSRRDRLVRERRARMDRARRQGTREDAARTPPEPPSATSELLGALLVALLAAAVIAVVALGIARFLGSRKAAPESAGALPEGARGDRPRPAPSEIDALAAEGRYAEAVHAMLEIAIAALARGGRLPLSDDMTAREALRELDADEVGRRALGELVLAVEISHFGGRTLDRQDYDRCAAALERIASRPLPAPALPAASTGAVEGAA